MDTLRIEDAPAHTDIGWTPFPGGELEGQRTRAVCPACRAKRLSSEPDASVASRPALCFQCYRAEFERNRKIKAAGELDTASEARFQVTLPFEAVNTPRLARLKIEREHARTQARVGAGDFVVRRRRAQIQARQALDRIFKGLKQRSLTSPGHRVARESSIAVAVHAAELQLPESWLPFVVAR
jgi:hypothetical protein